MGVELDAKLRQRLMERLGFSSEPQVDLDGLKNLYRAWSDTVPFDNAAKLIALRTGAPGVLPGIDPNQFVETFLEHGVTGTCWASANILYLLVRDAGFDAQRLAGSMRDSGMLTHGTTRVTIDGEDWIIDPAMLSRDPIPASGKPFDSSGSLWGVEVEAVDGTHVIWWDAVPSPEYIPCRLQAEPVTYDFYLDGYEASRERSPFNERIYVRRNRPDGVLVITGNRRFVKTDRGVEASLLSESELEEHLRNETGFSSDIVDALRECGAITASMIPPSSPPPPQHNVRPSRRVR